MPNLQSMSYEISPNIPFRVQKQLIHIILHTFSPSLPAPTPATQPSPLLGHTIIYAPHAQTISIYHASPPQPRSQPPKDYKSTPFPILQRHPAHPSHHHPLHPLQTLQICLLHCKDKRLSSGKVSLMVKIKLVWFETGNYLKKLE